MGFVILERAGIDDAAQRESEPRLALEEGDVVHEPEAQAVRLALEHPAIEQALDVGRRHRPIADAALGPLHLDQGLEPIHAAAAGAHDLDFEAFPLGRLVESGRDLVGAERQRAGIAGDEQARAHACASLSSASSFFSSSMAKTRSSSSMAAGEEWHSPRQ